MTRKLTSTEAREAARSFISTFVATGRQWTVEDVEGHLPRGWRFDDAAYDATFHPVTVSHVARLIRAYATQE